MDKNVFNKIRQIVYKKSGINLGDNKEALVSARLSKRMRVLNISDYRDYLRYLLDDDSHQELVYMIDAISTNVTHFFREEGHFDFLSEAMADWLANGQSRFRFWSAACSTGEEPYSIAMTLLETLNGRNVDLKILATDISVSVLERCKLGNYSEEKVKRIPAHLKTKYFEVKNEEGEKIYSAKDELKRIIVFKRLNLSNPPFPMHGPLDAVFCRNVMIYFDNDVRKRLLREIIRLLKPGGFLMVGHAESLAGMLVNLKSVKPSIYVKK